MVRGVDAVKKMIPMLKINTKINLLVVAIVAATVIFTLLMQTLKSQELQHYTLVEQVKSMNSHILKALIEEKKIGFTNSPGEAIFISLDNAANVLGQIDPNLLGQQSSSVPRIFELIGRFRSSMLQLARNNAFLKEKKDQLLAATRAYNKVYNSVSQRIDKEIADSQLYNWENVDTLSLLELKRSSSFANNLIGEIILSTSQELFLEKDIDAFEKKYDQAIFALGIQEENLKLQVRLLKGTQYTNIATRLTKTYAMIELLMPQLQLLFRESRGISETVDEYEQAISSHTDSLITLSESLRLEKNRAASMVVVLGLPVFFVFLIVGGLIFSRSITQPLSALVQAIKSIRNDALEDSTSWHKLDIPQSGKDEIGVLTQSFISMEDEIHNKIALLKQSEENLEITLNSIGDAVIATDLAGSVNRMNPMAQTLTGWEESRVIGRPLTDVFHITSAKTGQILENPIEKVLAQCKIIGLANQTQLTARDGTVRQIADSAAPIKNEAGEITGGVLIFRDVTKEYQMREAKRESEARYQRLFSDSNEAIFITSREGKIIESNPAATKLFGYSMNALKQVNIIQLYANPEQRGRFRAEIEEKGEVKNYELAMVGKNGEVLTCLMNATVKYSKEGEITGYQGTLRNVTEQRRLELQLQQDQKMESIGTLAGGIAHDFNNILSGIFGYSQLARDNIGEPEKAVKQIDQVIRGARRAADLVQQILTFSRQTEYRMYPFCLYMEINEALKLLRSSLPSTIEIEQHLNSKSKALADPMKIHRVIMNLCTNAYHAMRKTGGGLTVSLDDVEIDKAKFLGGRRIYPGQYIRLEVSDTGAGMDKQTLEKAFEPYFTTKKIGQGTGLGLALVQAIVDEHDGFLEVASTPGQGTEFLLYFPIVKDKTEKSTEKVQKPARFKGSETIMIVDDEKDIRDIYQSFLSSYGYQVHTYKDGLDAFNAFETGSVRFDMIITDMTMPGLTGEALARNILKIDPKFPMILCTGFSETLTETKAAEIGIKRLLQKPISNIDLVTVIREICDGK